MSNMPMSPQDLIASLGPGSPAAQQQLQTFQAGRDMMYQQIAQLQAQRMGVPQVAQQSGQTVPMAHAQQQQTPYSAETLDPDLMAAAKYWGIPDGVAQTMPRQHLIDTVNQYRQSARPVDGTLASAVADVASVPAQVALGAGEAITGGLQHLPLIGEWLGRSELLQAADSKLRQAEEAVRSSTSDSFQWVESGANVAGNLGAMFYPGEAAWAAAGKIGAVTPFIAKASPIARAAFQGGVSAFLMEGAGSGNIAAHMASGAGMDAQDKQNAMRIAMAVGGGSVLGAAFSALSTKITKSFLSPKALDTMSVPADLRSTANIEPGAQGPSGIFYMGEATPSGPLPPSRQLPPGPASAVGGHIDQLVTMANDYTIPEDQRQQAQMMLDHLRGTPPTQPQPALGAEQATGVASQLNKVATIVESPEFTSIAGQAAPNDNSVVQAAVGSNPGGVSLIQGIQNPAEFVANLGSNVRFANRGSRLDALVSDTPLRDAAVAQYEQHGVFEGQRALLPNGVEGEITGVNPGIVSVKPIGGGAEWHVPLEDIMPKVNSAQVKEVPQMWYNFLSYADQRVVGTAQAMGGALTPEQLGSIRSQNLPTYMEDYLTAAGVDSQAERAKIRGYFNIKYVDGYKDMMPIETLLQQNAMDAAAAVHNTATPLQPLSALDQAAATKGYRVVPDGANGRIMLMDAVDNTPPPTPGAPPVQPTQPAVLAFDSVDSAAGFVKTLDRDLPDITPPSTAPVELAGMVKTESMQDSNLNGVHEQHLDRALADIDPFGVNAIQQQVQSVPGIELMRKSNQYTDGMAKFTPMSFLMSNMDTALRKLGINTNLLTDYSNILQAHDLNTNFKQPYIQQAATILSKIDESKLISGQATLIHEIQDPVQRLAAFQAAGFRPEEIQAMNDLGGVFKDMFPHTQLDPMREIMNYLPRVAQRQSMGAAKPWEDDALNEITQPFYEYMRTGNLNTRELDPRNLVSTYVNALGWQTHMADVYSGISTKWQQMSDQIPELKPFTDVMGNWLQIVKHGYNPADDAALDAVHATMQTLFGKSVTRDQAKEMFNFSLDTSQSALLGFRPHVLARDFMRLLYAVPTVGHELLSTIGTYLTNPESRQAMWDSAIGKGWSQLDRTSTQSPAYFEAGEGAAAGVGSKYVDPQQSLRMQVLHGIYTTVADALPATWRDPNPGTFSPMYWIGKQAETMKMLVGNAQYGKTMAALNDFRTAGVAGDAQQLLKDSGMSTLPEAYQNAFLQHVTGSSDDQAATFAARSMVDMTMFRYGSLENPQISKTLMGRIGLQLGNFGIHSYQYAKNALQNNTAKSLALFGTVSYALHAAHEATQWDWQKLNPLESMGFSGGPWMEPMVQTVAGLGGAASLALGAEGSAEDRSVAAAAQLKQVGGTVLDMFNPIAGVTRTVGGIGQAMGSPTPGQALTRLATTGEVGAGVDISNSRTAWANNMLQQSIPVQQQAPSPMRMQSYGYGGVPQGQQPVYPPSLSTQGGGGSHAGYQPDPTQVAPPGGSSMSYRPVAQDTSVIPFNNNLQPGTPSVYDYHNVEAALHGDQNAQRYFAPDEVQFMQHLQGVPSDIAINAFRDFMAKKTAQQSGPAATQHYPGGSGSLPASSNPGPSGGGAMF